MIDGGEKDDKLVAVPSAGVDPTWDEIRSIEDLPRMERDRIEAFFRVYKDRVLRTSDGLSSVGPGDAPVRLEGTSDRRRTTACRQRGSRDRQYAFGAVS